jgi:glyoxalase family protein
LHAVTLSERELDPTGYMLTELLGMSFDSDAQGAAKFQMGQGASGAQVEVLAGVQQRGLQAGGTVHHVAFSAPDLPTMELWQQELLEKGIQVTQIMDRQYFKSIYFREPGGVLFEIATDDPGFAIDEPLLELGKSLKLPPWLEPSREQIQASLPAIRVD